jgi:hypothetical protein
MNNVTIRLITNGYIVGKNGLPPAPGMQEIFCATLDDVKALLDTIFAPAQQS